MSVPRTPSVCAPINLGEKIGLISELWTPKVVADHHGDTVALTEIP